MPKKHIFIDSQSSLLPGFTESFNVLAHWDRNDLKPMFLAHSTFQSDINITITLEF